MPSKLESWQKVRRMKGEFLPRTLFLMFLRPEYAICFYIITSITLFTIIVLAQSHIGAKKSTKTKVLPTKTHQVPVFLFKQMSIRNWLVTASTPHCFTFIKLTKSQIYNDTRYTFIDLPNQFTFLFMDTGD